jgi:alkylated DNA repair dioxygenase AlkB
MDNRLTVYINDENGVCYHIKGMLSKEQCDTYYQRLVKETPWHDDVVVVKDETYVGARKVCTYGDPDLSYEYSGKVERVSGWDPLTQELKEFIEKLTQEKYNFVVLNYYRDGNDKIGWHSDKEHSLQPNSTIASLTFGTTRDFMVKPKEFLKERYTDHPHFKKGLLKIPLEAGDVLIMGGRMQKSFLHTVPIRKGIVDGRVNLTFRMMKKTSEQ